MDPSALLSLREATAALPLPVAGHMLAALDSGRHRIGAFTFESQLTVCPVAAAAIEAGIWADGHVELPTPHWGGPDSPSEAFMDFVGSFDWCALEHDLPTAVDEVLAELARRPDLRGARESRQAA